MGYLRYALLGLLALAALLAGVLWSAPGINAGLPVGGSISGTVTEDGGGPLADICVDVSDTTFTFYGFGITDSSGNYSVGGLPTASYKVQFYDCGSGTHIGEWYNDKPDSTSADLVAVTVAVDTPGINAGLAVGADSDGDGWSDAAEAIIGTDPLDDCADNSSDDAHPADINNDTLFTSADMSLIAGVIGQAAPPARRDIAPATPDGFFTSADMSQVAARIGESCAP